MIGQKEKYYRFALGGRSRKFFLFFALLTTAILLACSNSQGPESDNPFSQDDIEQNLYSSEQPASSSSTSASSTSQQSESSSSKTPASSSSINQAPASSPNQQSESSSSKIPVSSSNQQSESSSSKIPVSSSSQQSKSSSSKTPASSSYIKEYLPLNDTEYPYAGLPRIVIETENHRQILDRETEIPAKLQVWGEKAPESEILELTIRGRGNSSWLMMPKKSYKIKFNTKYSPLGMPSNKDWNLVSNYADKSLLKNTLSYRLSELLEMDYTPKNKFFEFYLNREYLGVYLLTETVEFAHNRINEPSGTYLVEFDNHSQSKDQTISTNKGITYTVHYPKKATNLELAILKNHLDSLETIFSNNSISDSTIYQNFDIDAYIKYYWVQEYSKNKDGAFLSSVYFTWSPGGKIKMGPLWDFDGAYGVNPYYNAKNPSGWLIRNHYWNTALFQNKSFTKQVSQFWKDNNILFHSLADLIKCYKDSIYSSTKNNFKRWPILGETSDVLHQYPFSTYDEVVDTLKTWINNRLEWIDDNL